MARHISRASVLSPASQSSTLKPEVRWSSVTGGRCLGKRFFNRARGGCSGAAGSRFFAGSRRRHGGREAPDRRLGRGARHLFAIAASDGRCAPENPTFETKPVPRAAGRASWWDRTPIGQQSDRFRTAILAICRPFPDAPACGLAARPSAQTPQPGQAEAAHNDDPFLALLRARIPTIAWTWQTQAYALKINGSLTRRRAHIPTIMFLFDLVPITV
jgi:hypothetical protein